MATNVHLTPELEQFIRECIEGGHYDIISEVISAALRLLQDSEERHRDFLAMLHEAEAEADRLGIITVDDVGAEADAIVDANDR